jgi:predicted TPR repeat methyltransferase
MNEPHAPGTGPGTPRVHDVEVSLDEALQIAVAQQIEGRLDEAESVYGQVLAKHPDHPDALHYMGVLRHQQKRSDEGVALIRRAIAASPGYVDAHNNLGNVLTQTSRFEEAVAVYEKLIELRPEFAKAWNNLGIALKNLGRVEEAIAAFQRAIAIESNFGNAYFNLGNALKKQGRMDDAITAYTLSVRLECDDWPSFRNLGNTLYAVGRIREAGEVYADWLKREPDHPIALHMLAACTGTNEPERASNAYVAQHFDSFSKSFDQILTALNYRAPDLLTTALRAECPDGAASLDILDAGCGTGWCGPALKPMARRLIGVDLSRGMLDKAKARGVYDDLVEGELTEYLAESRARFDVVLSADTLVYFGRLDPVIAAAANALRPGGRLLFTVETAPEEDLPGGHRFNPHGRYTHAESYVRRALAAGGFTVRSCVRETLRTEKAAPVAGLVVVAVR